MLPDMLNRWKALPYSWIKSRSRTLTWMVSAGLFVTACEGANQEIENDPAFGISYYLRQSATGNKPTCKYRQPNTGVYRDRSGSYWYGVPGGNWCEYRNYVLRHEWMATVNSQAERLLSFSKDEVFLGYIAPYFTKVNKHHDDECRTFTYGENDANLFPRFGSLSVCTRAVSNKHIISYTVVKTPFGHLPIIIFDPINSEHKTDLVYLMGGPYVNRISSDHQSNLIGMIANQGRFRVFLPLYLGTTLLYVENSSNIDLAEKQISYFLSKITRSSPQSCVIGTSLGGYLLASIDLTGFSRLLISPLLDSPAEMVTRTIPDKNNRPALITLKEVSTFDWGEGRMSSGKRREIPSSSAFLRYFGSDVADSLEDRLRMNKSDLDLAYGSKDERIGLKTLPKIASKIGTIRLHNVGPVGHNYDNADTFWAFEPIISQFLSNCDVRREDRIGDKVR